MGRNALLDILKLIMAFMVVAIHTGFLSDLSELAEYLSLFGFFRIAVPLFLIINGFYFYPVVAKNNQLAWFKRVAVLHLVWMTLYSYFWFSIPLSLRELFQLVFRFLMGYWHLWYVSGMFGAGVMMIAVKQASLRILITLIVLTFIAGVAIQYGERYHAFSGTALEKITEAHWAHRNFLLLSFPFFCIGFLINKYSLHETISIKIASLLCIIGTTLLFMESYLNFCYSDRENGMGFDVLASLIILCPSVFLLFARQYGFASGKEIVKYSRNIANYASAIYFVHVFILFLIANATNLRGSPLTVAVFVASGFASYFIIRINRRLGVFL